MYPTPKTKLLGQAIVKVQPELKSMKIAPKVKVKCHQLPATSSVHHGTHFYRVTSISGL